MTGIDAVLVVGSHLHDCHYISGINQTLKRRN
ncbi:hydrogenase iron-sulfur subunit [Chloroflexota bacterium]